MSNPQSTAEVKRISESAWIWYGRPAHFICAEWCRFHMATKIGGYIVSSVGLYIHPRHVGGSEQQDYAYRRKNPNGEEIGCGRFYETMVFRAGEPCKAEGCACGLPTISGSEIDSDGYQTTGEAHEGHR